MTFGKLLVLVGLCLFVSFSESIWESTVQNFDMDLAVRQLENSDDVGTSNRLWYNFEPTSTAMFISFLVVLFMFRKQISGILRKTTKEVEVKNDKS